jgi:hypothetical protein
MLPLRQEFVLSRPADHLRQPPTPADKSAAAPRLPPSPGPQSPLAQAKVSADAPPSAGKKRALSLDPQPPQQPATPRAVPRVAPRKSPGASPAYDAVQWTKPHDTVLRAWARAPEGGADRERYEALLLATGKTPRDLEARRRELNA